MTSIHSFTSLAVEHATVKGQFGDVPVKPRLQKDLDSFVAMWWRNIKEQGFFEKAKELSAKEKSEEPGTLSPLERDEARQGSPEQPKSLVQGPENQKPPEPLLAPGIDKEDVTMSETSKPVTEQNGDERKPEAKLSCGDVRGSVWLNRSEKGGEYLTVSIARMYRGQDGTMKTTQSFRQMDLPDLIELAQGAQKIVQEESQKLGLESQTEGQRVKITR